MHTHLRAFVAKAVLVLACTASALSAQEGARPDNEPATPRPPAPGVSASLDSARAVVGENLEVYVYTYGAGDFVFEKFGHIALAIADRRTGEEVAFNWGMFDFDSPNFLTRFLTGNTRYWMQGYPSGAFNAVYQSQNRTIRRQTLALSPMARGALRDFVVWNAAEENRYYRYDYYSDNCSTRIRDALDWALNGALHRALAGPGRGVSWRDETARITATDLPVYAGIQIALGQPADHDLTAWQETFLPDYFATHLARVQFAGNGGALAPLVSQDTLIYRDTRTPMPEHAPDRRVPAAIFGVALGLALMLLARAPSGAAQAVVTTLGTLWFAVGGLLGTALLLAGTVTKHAPYMGRNLTLFQLHPLLLVAAVCWWARNRDGASGRTARLTVAMIAVISLVGVVAQHLPVFHQHNTEVWFLVAPVHLGAAFAAFATTSRRTLSTSRIDVRA